MSTGTGHVDLLAAIVTYLNATMAEALGGSPRVWSDYAPQTPPPAYPYAVIHDGVEAYRQQTEDHPDTGYWISNIVTGQLQVAFYATSKQQARSLGRLAARLLSDSMVTLASDEARFISIYPERSESQVIGDTATVEGQAFVRIVTFTYVQQYGEPAEA